MNSPDQHVPVGSSDQIGMPNIVVNAQKVADTLATGNQVSESFTEAFKFWLTSAEKQSIEADITAKKPIFNTRAYRKFLKSIFPNKSITFPYLASYDDALIVVSELSMLFWKPVRLPTRIEAMESLKEDDDTLMGYRDEIDGVVKGIGYCGYTWISDDTSDKYASSVCRVRGKRGGGSGQIVSSRNSGRSVIPIFG